MLAPVEGDIQGRGDHPRSTPDGSPGPPPGAKEGPRRGQTSSPRSAASRWPQPQGRGFVGAGSRPFPGTGLGGGEEDTRGRLEMPAVTLGIARRARRRLALHPPFRLPIPADRPRVSGASEAMGSRRRPRGRAGFSLGDGSRLGGASRASSASVPSACSALALVGVELRLAQSGWSWTSPRRARRPGSRRASARSVMRIGGVRRTASSLPVERTLESFLAP